MGNPKGTNGKKALNSDKAKRFVVEYLIDMNATQACKRAGYSGNDNTLKKHGHMLLRQPDVAEAIAAEMAAQRERVLITADQVLLDIQRVGDKAETAGDWAQALRSRELLGKRYKLFTDKVEVVNNTPRAERLRDARLRRQQGSE